MLANKQPHNQEFKGTIEGGNGERKKNKEA